MYFPRAHVIIFNAKKKLSVIFFPTIVLNCQECLIKQRPWKQQQLTPLFMQTFVEQKIAN